MSSGLCVSKLSLINLYKILQIVAKKSKKEDFSDKNRFDFRKQEIISLLGTRKSIFNDFLYQISYFKLYCNKPAISIFKTQNSHKPCLSRTVDIENIFLLKSLKTTKMVEKMTCRKPHSSETRCFCKLGGNILNFRAKIPLFFIIP